MTLKSLLSDGARQAMLEVLLFRNHAYEVLAKREWMCMPESGSHGHRKRFLWIPDGKRIISITFFLSLRCSATS